jgi:hypothetical protein
MQRPSLQRIAEISIVVLLVIVARSLGEVFRLRYMHGAALTIPMLWPFVTGALFASVAVIMVSVCYFAGRYKLAIALALATIAGLFVYKVFLFG